MRYLLLAVLVVSVPCCAARKQSTAPTPSPEIAGQLNPDSAESQMIAARAHLEMGCPTDGTYHVSRQGTEYHVQVKYVAGYGTNREPIHAPNRGALVVLDQQGKLVRIDGADRPRAAAADEALATDNSVPSPGAGGHVAEAAGSRSLLKQAVR
jgi:hypothetical protein